MLKRNARDTLPSARPGPFHAEDRARDTEEVLTREGELTRVFFREGYIWLGDEPLDFDPGTPGARALALFDHGLKVTR